MLDSQHNTDISVDCEGRSLKYFSITWMSVSDTLNYIHTHHVSSVSYVSQIVLLTAIMACGVHVNTMGIKYMSDFIVYDLSIHNIIIIYLLHY